MIVIEPTYVMRGGMWHLHERSLRVSRRCGSGSTFQYVMFGFRIVAHKKEGR